VTGEDGGLRRRLARIALGLAALPTGLLAGFFYAYACSVTPALARLDAAGYVAAMQAINATVRNPAFAAAFFGAPLLTAAAVLLRLPRWREPAMWACLAALLLQLGGTLAVTAGRNVPLNEALALVDPSAAAALLEAARQRYEAAWNFWNLVRTLAATAALACLLLGLWLDGRGSAPARAGTRSAPRD
jgi:uncharacterized membrane protein